MFNMEDTYVVLEKDNRNSCTTVPRRLIIRNSILMCHTAAKRPQNRIR